MSVEPTTVLDSTLLMDAETRSALVTCLASAGAAGFVAICYELRKSNIPKTLAQRIGDIMIGGAAGFMVGAIFGDQFSLVVTMGFGGFAGASGSRLFDIAKMNLEAGFASAVRRLFGITGADVSETMDHLRQQDDLQDAIEDKPGSGGSPPFRPPSYNQGGGYTPPPEQDDYSDYGPEPDDLGSGSYDVSYDEPGGYGADPSDPPESPPQSGGFDPSRLPDLP